MDAKLSHMPDESREKLGETLGKIINEGSNGLICILLCFRRTSSTASGPPSPTGKAVEMDAKLSHMPDESREKLGETLGKIINEGSNGLICILL